MDGWIKTAWRAFWVGLGASAVLITQSLIAPRETETTKTTKEMSASAPDELPWAAPAPQRAKSFRPLGAGDPFDAVQGRVAARVHDES